MMYLHSSTHMQAHHERINKYAVAKKVWDDMSFSQKKALLKRLSLDEKHASKDLQQIETNALQDIIFDLTIACTRH